MIQELLVNLDVIKNAKLGCVLEVVIPRVSPDAAKFMMMKRRKRKRKGKKI